jgi:phospholipase C
MNPPDLVHRFYQEQLQIDGGKMDKFVAVSDAKGVMGDYYTGTLPLAAEARRYTLCDNFFHAAFGGSFLNHFWFIAARTPVFPNARRPW